MKVLPFTIAKPDNVTLYKETYKGESFYEKLHKHNEIQISYITAGEGTFIIGDYLGDYKKGDIFVIGENLPHIFKGDEISKQQSEMLSIFFSKNSFGEPFFNLPEFNHMQNLFDDLQLGVKIKSCKTEIANTIKKVDKAKKFEQFMMFMQMLNLLAEADREVLSSLINLKKYMGNEGKRMSDIFQFTMNNFQKEISLQEVSNVANMTPNAFCRYFKQRTNKTFVNFLIDIRIGNACKLLAKNNDFSITEISYKSGFNNLANFNRKFKAIKGITPSEYRKKH